VPNVKPEHMLLKNGTSQPLNLLYKQKLMGKGWAFLPWHERTSILYQSISSGSTFVLCAFLVFYPVNTADRVTMIVVFL